MFFIDWLRTIVSNLNRMRGRVVLTAFGVVIGTTAVMVLVSLGAGLQQSATGSLGGIANLKRIDVSGPMGEKMIMPASESGVARPRGSSEEVKSLTNAVLEEIRAIPGVEAVIPVEEPQGGASLRYRKLMGGGQIIGATEETLLQLGLKVEEGVLELARGQMVVGSNLQEMFWDEQRGRPTEIEKLLGETITIEAWKYSDDGSASSRSYRYQVVGVLASGGESDYQVFIPFRDVQVMNEWSLGKRIDRNKEGYPRVIVQVQDTEDVTPVQSSIREMGYSAYSAQDTVQEVNRFFRILQAVLGSIGAIALLVAALGIVNTLSMAILERTREIGLMKALGARNRDVMGIFLGEAAFIGFLGGLFGVLLGLGISLAGNAIIGSIMAQSGGGVFGPDSTDVVHTPAWLPPFAILFATLIGLVSGVYPALRAATLDPLRALKYE